MLKRYLSRHKKTIAVFFLFVAVMGGVFALFEIPVEAVGYGAVLCAFLGLILMSLDFRKFCVRSRLLECVKKELTVTSEHLPEPTELLEQEYQELLLEMQEAYHALEQQNQTRYEEMMEYYTMWVHQIKTPISAMRLLLQEDAQKNGAELSELFKIEQYVEMVLGYLRTEDVSSDMQFQEYQLDKIIKEQIHKYARIFIGKKLRLDYTETGLQVLTDEKWLGFVIGQVLSNSLKYTKTGQIRIYLSQSRPQTLVIEDTGIGISAQDLPRIFEKGFTGHNGRQENRSTGIGLYLCAKIMKKLGHGIYVESVQNNGTRVYLDLKQDKLTLYS